jgi:hypothetical protein
MTVLIKKNLIIRNHGLDPDLDPDWIGVQQHAGSGSGFSENTGLTL